MIAAVEDIGRGQIAEEADVFALARAACRLSHGRAETQDGTRREARSGDPQIELGLNAAIVTVRGGHPHILVVRPARRGPARGTRCRSARSTPRAHRTLEIGLREWVRRRPASISAMSSNSTPSAIAGAMPSPAGPHMLSVGYLALTRGAGDELARLALVALVCLFPLGGLAQGRPGILDRRDRAEAQGVGRAAAAARRAGARAQTARAAQDQLRHRRGMGRGEGARALRAALRGGSRGRGAARRPARRAQWPALPELGRPMAFDHRRILATAIGRLRGKLKYRPVVFELLPPEFTLSICKRRSKPFPARSCTSRISGGWSSKAALSRPPATFRRRPEGVPRGSTASAAKSCSSARPRAFVSKADVDRGLSHGGRWFLEKFREQ